MEILKTINKKDIPQFEKMPENKLKLFKSVATLSIDEALELKLKNESEAVRISGWLKSGFKNSKFKLTRRKKNNQLFAYIYRES